MIVRPGPPRADQPPNRLGKPLRRRYRRGVIRLFHLSDIHFGAEDAAALAWARDCIAAERPDAVAITGDLTMRARPREYRAARAWIGRLAAPVHLGIGNHDMPYFNPLERCFAPYRRYRRLAAAVETAPALAGLALVPLRTTAPAQWRLNWSKGVVSEAALAACLAALDALPPGTRALVCAHHPLVETGTHGTALTRGGARALAELARRGVLAVLSGHVHDPFDLIEHTAQGPVRMIGAGTLSTRLRSTPPSFNALTWDGHTLTVRVRTRDTLAGAALQLADVPDDAAPPRYPDDLTAPLSTAPAAGAALN